MCIKNKINKNIKDVLLKFFIKGDLIYEIIIFYYIDTFNNNN